MRFVVPVGACALLLIGSAAGRGSEPSRTPEALSASDIARGRYLTHDVAMCVQCHSPRDDQGEIIRSQEFRGAPIPVTSPFPGSRWALRAPNIRGVDAYPEADLIRLLREGINRRGIAPQRPMPPFRMTREDAEAIAAYLRSLD
jgi:mono/diheme cytochrome c family protein